MRRYPALIILLMIALSTSIVSAQSTSAHTIPYVYRIKIDGCQFKPSSRRQTGFRVAGMAGVVTALHGVVDCKIMSAVADDGQEIFNDLAIRQVDIARDIVLLSSPELDNLPREGLAKSVLTAAEIGKAVLRIVGYPLGLDKQDVDVNIVIRDIESLDDVIPDAEEPEAFTNRRSPDININVLNVQAQLLPGHSGAPLLNSRNQVVGVGDGGLREGTVGRSWAIPWQDIRLQSIKLAAVKNALDSLALQDPGLALSFSSTFPTQSTEDAVERRLGAFIIDKATGDPLRGAEVTLTFKEGYGYLIAYTDSIGAFTFTLDNNVASRLGELQVELQGYQSVNFTLVNNRLPTETIALTSEATPEAEATEPTKVCEVGLRVFDAETRTAIEGAQVTFTYHAQSKSDYTDSDGYASVTFACNETFPTMEIDVSFEGHVRVKKNIQFAGDERIYLTPSANPPPSETPTMMPSPTSIPLEPSTPSVAPPTPTKSSSDILASCPIPADPDLRAYWTLDLGCPTESSHITWATYTPYERGMMMWRDDTRLIYGFFNGNGWMTEQDIFQEGMPDMPSPNRGEPPPGLLHPLRGVGLIWATKDIFFQNLGWAKQPPKGFCAETQNFSQGFILRASEQDSCFDSKSGQNQNSRAREADFSFTFLSASSSEQR